MVRVASRLKPVDPLRPLTYSKLFGLLAATGMRRSEALNLLDDDVGPDGQRLVIRLTKFRKSRQLPLYPSTASALLTYRGQRNQQWPRTPARPFFVGHTGMPLPGPTLHSVFTGLRRSLGWRARGDLVALDPKGVEGVRRGGRREGHRQHVQLLHGHGRTMH